MLGHLPSAVCPPSPPDCKAYFPMNILVEQLEIPSHTVGNPTSPEDPGEQGCLDSPGHVLLQGSVPGISPAPLPVCLAREFSFALPAHFLLCGHGPFSLLPAQSCLMYILTKDAGARPPGTPHRPQKLSHQKKYYFN